MTQKEKDIKRLIKYISKEDVILFLGSGFSLKGGAPSVYDVKEAIVQDGGDVFALEVGDIQKISLADLTEKHVEYHGGSRNDLISVLQKLFDITSTDMSDHELLQRISHFKTIYTTNYDTFVESSYPHDVLQVVNTNKSCAFAGVKPVTLYKIHGDLSTLHSPDSVIITKSDYKEYFRGKRFDQLWTQFKADAAKHHILFIGYSLEDPNILNIIKELRKQVGTSLKEMFLVAPNMNAPKRDHLRRYVTYIDAKAEDILPVIIDTLKDTINDDFKHKRVSAEVHSRFCDINGSFQSDYKVGRERNEITKFSPLRGSSLKHELKLNLSGSFDLNNPLTYTSSMQYGDTDIKIPAIRLSRDRMNSFTHTLNSIALAHKDDIADLLIGPATDSLEWTIISNNLKFKEKVKGCRYVLVDKVHINLQTPVYIIHMYQSEDNTWLIEFEFNKTVPSTQLGKQWVELLIDSTKSKSLSFDKFKIHSDDDMSDLLERLNEIKLYFDILSELEFTYNINFKRIDNYSEQNFTNALILLSYLSKGSVRHKIDNDGRFSLNIDDRKLNGTIPILRMADLMLTRCDRLGRINLCGNEYEIRYLITIYNDLKLVKCESDNPDGHIFSTVFAANVDTEDIMAIDELPEEFRYDIEHDGDEGLALYYKPGERKKYNIP